MGDLRRGEVLKLGAAATALAAGSRALVALAAETTPSSLTLSEPHAQPDEISLTGNSISIDAVAKNSKDPALQEIARDHAVDPNGPPTEQNLPVTAFVCKYSKYPNAGKQFLRFVCEADQYNAWMTAANGYISQLLEAYAANSVRTADPKNIPDRDVAGRSLEDGYTDPLGFASAAVTGDFIVVAGVRAGSRTLKAAAQRAADRANAITRSKAAAQVQ
jgi:multiple sugar transport system substrate-binding protein